MSRKKVIFLILVFLFALNAPLPAFAASITGAVRNPDGSVTVTWTDGEQGKTLTIERSLRPGGGHVDIAEVQQVDGSYTDRTADPDETLYYRLHYGVGKFTPDVEVQPYKPPDVPPPDAGVPEKPRRPTKDEGGMLERAIAGVVNGFVVFFEWLENGADLKSLDKLIFNIGVSEEDKEMSPFTRTEWDRLNVWYKGMSAVMGALLLIAIIMTAFKLFAAAFKPADRAEAVESMWRWVWALFIIAAAPILFYVVFSVNIAMVGSMLSVAENVLNIGAGGLKEVSLQGGVMKGLITGSVLATAIVKLILCGIIFHLNILFLIRKYALMAIYVFTPIMAWMWAMNKNVNAAGIWLGELLSNAFMQTAYALVFLLFLTFCDVQNWFQLLVWLMILLPIAEMLRNSVQGLFTRMSGIDESGAAGKVMGALGLGAMVGMGRLASTAAPRKHPVQPPSGGPSGGLSLGGREAPPSPPPISPPGGSPAGGSFGAFGPGSTTVSSGPAGNVGVARTSVSGASGLGELGSGSATQNLYGAQGARLSQVVSTSRAVGAAGAKALAAPAAVMFAAVPGGQHMVNLASAVGGAAGRAVGAVGGLAYQTAKVRKEEGVGVKEAFKQVTGGKDAARSIGRAATVVGAEVVSPGLSPAIAERWSQPKQQPSLDGYRHR
ncbi:MAG: hypothetical protein C4542_02155 [Dehalococcoidia bacterium]|nr:MAG: hypothetical protein C4542_02155 [Dehalococcoidia bacterium]